MSGNRENHGMTQTESDIAFLLADAADGVEIGIAPVQAVIHGGRRRRARRWAVAAGATLVIAGTTGAVALAGLPGTDGGSVVTQPSPSRSGTSLSRPHRTTLASGTEDGRGWHVYVDVWDAPRDRTEAGTQWAAMARYGETPPPDVRKASDLVGKTTYYTVRGYGSKEARVIQDSVPRSGILTGTDLELAAVRLMPGSDGPERLVIGHVAETAREVTCSWKDGTSTRLHRVPADGGTGDVQQGIRSAEGFADQWFVCLAPKGTAYKEVRVTR
ncbi:hypothetical protein [Streptomyces sp. NPDC056660]|uniref:hypothetical protein n=1 Tax=Streptomyces sp. NPDC056660 TaxID=3345897 RepID=UPI0036CE3A64